MWLGLHGEGFIDKLMYIYDSYVLLDGQWSLQLVNPMIWTGGMSLHGFINDTFIRNVMNFTMQMHMMCQN